jgi:membrane fusion protein, multidrug efflux system
MNTKIKILLIAVAVIAVLVFMIARNRTILNAPSKSATQQTAVSVSIAPVMRQSVNDDITAVGTVNAYNDVAVLSETQGRVVKVNVEVGQRVQAGAVLMQVDGEMKEAAFKAAQATYEKARRDLERYEALSKDGSASDTQIEQARWTFQNAEAQYIVARRQLSDTKITSPIAGIVTARNVNVGSMVMGAPQATTVANVIDISKVKIKASIGEKDMVRLNTGDAVQVTCDLLPGVVMKGSVFSISSKGDEGHTYPIEVVLANPGGKLKAGMFVNLVARPDAAGERLFIPRAALIGSIRDAKVFVVNHGVATLRAVSAGKGFGTSVEITGGLKEGELVVVDGQNNLTDNTVVSAR